MRLALPGSALVHAGAVSLLFIGFVWPDAQDAAAPAPVTVNIIPISNVATNATEVLDTSNTVSSLSAGGPETVEEIVPDTLEPVSETVEPVAPDRLEAVENEQLEPVQDTALAPQQIESLDAISSESVEAVELTTTAASDISAPPVAPLRSEPLERIETATLSATSSPSTVDPVETASLTAISAPATLEPVETQTLVTPPAMPTPLSERPPDRPAPRQAPRPQPAERRPAAPPTTAGNAGNSNADSTASAGSAAPRQSNSGSGGEAEVARYPSQVIGKLRNAMRRGGDRGEMIVRFTVDANGGLQGVSVSRSSGNAAVDAAGTALVQRAAPFPPIPVAAGRNSWTFDVPLAFGG